MEVQVSCVFYDRTTGSFDLSGQREFAHNKINIERKVKKGGRRDKLEGVKGAEMKWILNLE